MGTGADAVRREGGALSVSAWGWVWVACRAAWRGGMPKTVKHLASFLRDTGRLTATFAHNPVDLLHVQIVGDSKSVVAARRAGIPRVVGTHHLDPSRRKLYDLAPE